MMNTRERCATNLDAAIATMREACDDAERASRVTDAFAVQRVLHLLVWGMANATSYVESAMCAIEDGHISDKASNG